MQSQRKIIVGELLKPLRDPAITHVLMVAEAVNSVSDFVYKHRLDPSRPTHPSPQ